MIDMIYCNLDVCFVYTKICVCINKMAKENAYEIDICHELS